MSAISRFNDAMRQLWGQSLPDVFQFSTGMEIDYAVDAALPGWVRKNGGTIGSAASGATERANADTAALYALLWNNYDDSQAAVAGGRGASASADFAADKTIVLPDARGRATTPFLLGDENFGTLGLRPGTPTHALIEEELPVVAGHTHSFTPSQDITLSGHTTDVASGSDGTVILSSAVGAGSSSNTANGGGFGGDVAHNNIQPSIVTGCRLIKL